MVMIRFLFMFYKHLNNQLENRAKTIDDRRYEQSENINVSPAFFHSESVSFRTRR